MRKKNIISVLAAAGTIVLASSCQGETQNEYSQYQAYLNYDPTIAPLPPLQAAITGANTFACVSMLRSETGKYYQLSAQLYGGEAQTVNVTTATAVRTMPVLGVNNSTGLVVGNSSLQSDNPYVFDRVCPNCYAESRTKKYQLEFTNSGQSLYCSKCKRTYGLLNAGVITSGDSGKKLERYHATTTAVGGIIISN